MVKLSNFEIAFLSYSRTSTKMRKGRTLKENERKIGFAAHFRLLHAPCVLFNPKYPKSFIGDCSNDVQLNKDDNIHKSEALSELNKQNINI